MIITAGCTDQEVLSGGEFYEIYDVKSILLSVSSDLFVEGDPPIVLSGFAFNELRRNLTNLEITYFVNDEEIEGNSFTPEKSGIFRIRASISGLELLSNEVRINSVYIEDITKMDLSYSQIPFLTTNEWSTLGEFTLSTDVTGVGKITGKINNVIEENSQRTFFSGQQISQSGIYNFIAKFGTKSSNSITIEVREEPTLEEIRMPVIVHLVGGELSRTVEESLDE